MGNAETQMKLKVGLDQMFNEPDNNKQCILIKSLLFQSNNVEDLYSIVTENLLRSKKDLHWKQFIGACYSAIDLLVEATKSKLDAKKSTQEIKSIKTLIHFLILTLPYILCSTENAEHVFWKNSIPNITKVIASTHIVDEEEKQPEKEMVEIKDPQNKEESSIKQEIPNKEENNINVNVEQKKEENKKESEAKQEEQKKDEVKKEEQPKENEVIKEEKQVSANVNEVDISKEQKNNINQDVKEIQLDKQDNKEETKETIHTVEILEKREGMPYGARIIDTLYQLMFKENFTILEYVEDANDASNKSNIGCKKIWSNGLYCSHGLQSLERKYDSNRIDVLKLFITICSQCIYNDNTKYFSDLNPFLAYATNKGNTDYRNLFFSLMNTFLSLDKKKGIKNIGSLFTANLNADELSETCGQLLNVLISYNAPSYDNAKDLLNKKGALFAIYEHFLNKGWKDGNEELSKTFAINEFEKLLFTIEGRMWYDIIYDNLCKHLSRGYDMSFYVSDYKEYNSMYELIYFIFKFLTTNSVWC